MNGSHRWLASAPHTSFSSSSGAGCWLAAALARPLCWPAWEAGLRLRLRPWVQLQLWLGLAPRAPAAAAGCRAARPNTIVRTSAAG
eukprot:CAMPEP_0179102566 /NCGR_PEP_ID=MMETSP0796-20121207/47478_1 /TAXON_ID=73915 /ORGANISM="Pyrodinium bahamense, Strain pbaha01" /LENGTH=85 /DNA_ID=CAMNT_0020800445 /DNA_START=727 /DNA_END=980 /DNA_ORIENTATION=-